MNSTTDRLKTQRRIHAMVEAYWQDVKAAPAQGRPVCWSTMMTSAEMLDTLGYCVVYPENHAAACGAWKSASKLCQVAEDAGYSPDTCVYSRVSLGSLTRPDLCPVGGVPEPDLLVCVSYCVTVIKWYQALSRYFDVPLITIEYPFLHDKLDDADAKRVMSYASDQLRDAVPVAEKVAHRSLDYAGWQERLAITVEMAQVWQEIIELAQHVPSPVSAFDLFVNLFPMVVRGKAECLSALVELRAELRERIADCISAVPKETYRLHWSGIPIWYRLGDLRRRFAEAGANVVTSAYLHFWSYPGLDPARPFETILPSQICVPINSGLAGYADFLSNLARDYKIDGLVCQMSRSCKALSIGQYDVVERLRDEFGIPAMAIEADMCDDRSYSAVRVESAIASFMEVLATRPRPQS